MNQENWMDRFDDLQTLVLVADRQSIRQAADMLGRAPRLLVSA
jgi:DNA-binding transcriptional LysR family regulator